MRAEPIDAASSRSALQAWRGSIVLGALVVSFTVVVILWATPAHTFVEAGHLAAWDAAAARVEAAHVTGCTDPYAVLVTSLPGVGTIRRVCVGPASAIGSFEVTFQPAAGASALAYARGAPLPTDQCSSPLGAGWWQLIARDPTSMKCPRGFVVDPVP